MPFDAEKSPSVPAVMLTYENGRLSLPFTDPNLPKLGSIGRPTVSNASFGSPAGSYAVRMNRYNARERRRGGDWSNLDLPILLLWAESNFPPDNSPPDCDDDSCENLY
jgi:hypothetical protein